MTITRKPVAAYWLAGCLALGIAPAVHADVPRNPPIGADPFQEVLERIRGHAADDGWQKEGWKDERIEAWLDKLVGTIAKGADLPELTLPVRQAEVTPAPDLRRPLQAWSLLIGKDVKAPLARHSIILVDGNAELMSVEDCVVVARGVVSMRMCARSVIVSGTCIDSQYNGDPFGANGSLYVTRGWIHLRNAYGGALVAFEGTSVERSEGAVFVNSDVPPPGRLPIAAANPCRSVKIDGLPLQPLSLHPLSDKLELAGIVHGEPPAIVLGRVTSTPRGAVFRFHDRRYVADIGEPIVDEAGKPVEGLQGWELTSVAGNVAIFSNGDLTAVARMAAK